MFELGMAERLFRVIEYLRRPNDWAHVETLGGVATDPETRHYDESLEQTLRKLEGWAGHYAELAANEAMVPRDQNEEDACREVRFADGRDARANAIAFSSPKARRAGYIEFKFRGRLWCIHWSAGEECWSDPELVHLRKRNPFIDGIDEKLDARTNTTKILDAMVTE
jgi:hypothetical protein